MTKKWIEVNNLSGGQYSASKNITFKTLMVILNLCDYSDLYIVIKGTITAEGDDDENPRNVAEIIIPLEKKNRRNIKRIKTSIINMKHYKISKPLNDSIVSKFVTKNGSK